MCLPSLKMPTTNQRSIEIFKNCCLGIDLRTAYVDYLSVLLKTRCLPIGYMEMNVLTIACVVSGSTSIYPISPRSILQYIFFLLQPLSLIGIPKCATCANNNLNKQLFPPCLRNIVFIVMKLILVSVKDAYVQK